MFSLEIETLARLLIDEARQKSLLIVTAESCTGGLVSAAICAIPGASDVLDRGFVTYSNRAKQEMLGVPGDLIADLGAVSEPVARMMAEGALENSNAHLAVAITGIAGPDGGTRMKPVGTVHIATARTNHGLTHRAELFEFETRFEIQQAAAQALQWRSRHDELTGLFNRRHMLERLNNEKHRSIRSGRGFCLAMIDIDHFKRVNDQYGHGTGDQVLGSVASTISAGLRETDVVARWGGEEFLVMFTDTDLLTAERVLVRIQQALAQTTVAEQAPQLRVTFSAGVTNYRADEMLTRTIDRADRALYAAKAAGRACVLRDPQVLRASPQAA